MHVCLYDVGMPALCVEVSFFMCMSVYDCVYVSVCVCVCVRACVYMFNCACARVCMGWMICREEAGGEGQGEKV